MNILSVFEIIGTIAFAAAGALIGIQKSLDIFGIFMLALITAVGGGAIRDVFVGDIPFIFQKEVYAVASIFGAICFFYTKPLLAGNGPMYICFVVTVAIRICCMKYNINLPVLGRKYGMGE